MSLRNVWDTGVIESLKGVVKIRVDRFKQGKASFIFIQAVAISSVALLYFWNVHYLPKNRGWIWDSATRFFSEKFS